MMTLVLVLSLLQAQEESLDVRNTKLLVYDSARDFTLRVRNDGSVELTVREKDADGNKVAKTFTAPDVEGFRQSHADLVRRYGLARHLGARGMAQDEFEEWWGGLRRMPGFERFRVPEMNPQDPDLERFFQEQKELFDRLRNRFAPPQEEAPDRAVPGGREFGLKVDAVGETLRDQLSLKEGEGVLVAEVKPGSTAEKAGLKVHDIVVTIDGRPSGDRWEFRAAAHKALQKAEFEVEILRAGKRQTLKVAP